MWVAQITCEVGVKVQGLSPDTPKFRQWEDEESQQRSLRNNSQGRSRRKNGGGGAVLRGSVQKIFLEGGSDEEKALWKAQN